MILEETTDDILGDISRSLRQIAKCVQMIAVFFGGLSAGILTWIALTVFRK